MRDPNAQTIVNWQLAEDIKARRKEMFISSLLITMCPSFGHFYKFANDRRVDGVRFNSAMITLPELDKELEVLKNRPPRAPVFYDVKGRQMRILKVETEKGNLVLTINHPIKVNLPTVVLFKAGADVAMLEHIEETNEGQRLIFNGGPHYKLVPGESLHIRDKSFTNLCGKNVFTELEKQKVQKVKEAGINRWFLSYVESKDEVDLFQEMVGKDAEIWLKIESLEGLKYIQNTFKKQDNLTLVAARGDLFVEVDKPHHILQALKLIIDKDPKACAGSRILLSIVQDPVPSCADLSELAWLHDIGYRRLMLCDELCLKENLLGTAISVFDEVKREL